MAISDKYTIRLGREYYSKYHEISEYFKGKNCIIEVHTMFGHTFIKFENKKDMVTFKMEYL